MSHYLIEQIDKTANIDVWTHTSVIESIGETRLWRFTIQRAVTAEIEKLPASSLFIFIGAHPHGWLDGLIKRDDRGFVLSGPDLLKDGKRPEAGRTLDRDPGLLENKCAEYFWLVDVRHGSVKRVASGVGEGAVVVQFMHQYLAKVQ